MEKKAFSVFALSAVVVGTLPQAAAQTQIQNQPTEIITAAPLTTFSERAGLWPVFEAPAGVVPSETEPLTHYLNTLPGVQARRLGSPSLSIRGSAQAARVLTLFDDVPLFFNDGFGSPELFVPREILGELRLIKGPASVFYGPSAMAGALNAMPRLFDRPSLRLSAAEQSGQIGNTGALAVLPYRSGEDWLQASVFAEIEPGAFSYESVSSGLSGRRRDNSAQTRRYTVLARQKRGDWGFRERLLIASSSGVTPGPVTSPITTRMNTWGALAALDVSSRVGAATDASLRITSLWQDALFDRGSPTETRTTATRSAAFADLSHVFADGWTSRTFVDFAYEQFAASYLDQRRFGASSFELGQVLEIPLNETWTIQPGARWLGRFGEVFKTVAAVHEAERDRHWVTYSEGFRVPSLSDRFAQSAIYAGNPSLKPESSRQLEIGYLKRPLRTHSTFVEGLSYGAAIFAIETKNVFENRGLSATQAKKVNSGESLAHGGDVSASWSESLWTFSFAYSHLQGENSTTQEPLSLAPRHQLTTTFTVHAGPAVVELKHAYWSSVLDREYPSNVLRALPQWNVVDLNVRTIGLSNWEIRTGILNLFNEPRELTLGFPEPQRSLYFTALRAF